MPAPQHPHPLSSNSNGRIVKGPDRITETKGWMNLAPDELYAVARWRYARRALEWWRCMGVPVHETVFAWGWWVVQGGGCICNKYGEKEVVDHLRAAGWLFRQDRCCIMLGSETRSLVPGGEVPSRPGNRREGGERGQKNEHEGNVRRRPSLSAIYKLLLFSLFLETLLLWNVDRFVHGHILGNRAEVMLTSLQLVPRTWADITDRGVHETTCRDAEDQSTVGGGGVEKVMVLKQGPKRLCGRMWALADSWWGWKVRDWRLCRSITSTPEG